MIFVPERVGQIELPDQAVPPEQFPGIAVSHGIPVLEEEDPVGDRAGKLRLVQGQDDGRPLFPAQAVEKLEECDLIVQIENL